LRKLTLGLICLLASCLLCSPTFARGPERRSGEPFLRFIDDLLRPFDASREADPFAERIETDRHDFTQSTKTVGRGVIQLETGYSYFYNDDDDEIEQTHTGPESMLRLGLTEDIEFRLRWNYAWRFIDEADNEDSAQDMIMTFKLGMTAEDHLIPESALEIRGTAPTGGAAWSTTRVEFGLDYIYAWKLAEGWELYGSSGFATSGLDDFSLLPEEPDTDHFIVWSQSAALGVELTERTTLYVEWFGLFSYALEDDFGIGVGNLGVDYYVTDDFVVDFRIGIGLTGEADDFFSGIGGGLRM